MPRNNPTTELDARYSDEGATATPWSEGRERLVTAELYWLSTIRPDGRLHAKPLIGVWENDALTSARVLRAEGQEPAARRPLPPNDGVERPLRVASTWSSRVRR
jgi:hypothetical protein